MSRAQAAVDLPAPAAALADSLLAWYRRSARRLPWRGSRDPYAVWVSEVMLQQTQVATVLRYYERFLRDFPTVEALARAELPAVLARWSGLGYYGRARAMHAAAKEIARRGSFPATLEGLRELPGFGPYTAAAVGSIAFGIPEPAIDGNAVRVVGRLVAFRAPRAEAEKTLRELARPILAAGPPSEINQAVMDLGAGLCAAKSPACLLCPWRRPCRARRLGIQAEIPLPAPRPKRRPLSWVAAVLRDRRGRLLFARRPERGLFAGLWELPGGEVRARERLPAAVARLLHGELGLRARVGKELGAVSQELTHRSLRIIAFAAEAQGRPKARGYLEACWAGEAEARELALSSATRKLLAALEGKATVSRVRIGRPRR